MIKANFLNPEQRTELEQIVRRPSEDHGVARRANAILLLDDGKSCAVIAEFLYLDDDTVRTWHKHYLSGGLDRLTTFDWKGGLTFLNTAQKTVLCDWLEAHFIRDTRPIIAFVKAEFGVQYSHSGCLKLLHRLGFEYKKPKALPRVTDEAEQQQYIDMYDKLLCSLPADEAVYFAPSRACKHALSGNGRGPPRIPMPSRIRLDEKGFKHRRKDLRRAPAGEHSWRSQP